ncbi:MAG TPA: CarD family transcriptional regulator, partial [Gammaproteobacteria bacterium]|nr:CarD family transcriptional regulator [Gammaproteobacteria bacterium]
MLFNEFNLSLGSTSHKRLSFGSLLGCSLSLGLANIAIQHTGVLVVLVSDTQFASKLERELKFFLSQHQNEIPVLTFPDWETLPYDTFSPHHDIVSERLTTLCTLPNLSKGILLVSIATLMHRLCPSEYLLQNTVWLKKGQTFKLTTTRKRLIDAGYHCVPAVMAHGEFAVRGSILDLFPMGSEHPFRIDLFGDEIDSIRMFDVETQRSSDKMAEVKLLPAREFPLTEAAISTFRTQFRTQFEGDPTQCSLYLDVSDGNASPGLEYYLPLFFEKTSHLFEYLPENCLMVQIENLEAPALAFWEHVKERYEQYCHDRLRPILEPKALFLQPTEVFSKVNDFPKIILTKENLEEKNGIKNLSVKPLPSLFIEARAEKPLAKLAEFLLTFKGSVLFCAESTGRREVLKELLTNIGCRPVDRGHWSDFLAVYAEPGYSIMIAPLEEGIILEKKQGNIAIITEAELLGQRVMQRRLRKTERQSLDREVHSLAELSIGAPVVHVDYGIGRYLGLTRLNHSGSQEGEFVTLEYAGGDKLYVPV